MSTDELTAMSEEDIKEFLAHYDVHDESAYHLWSRRMGHLILAWIEATAKAEHATWLILRRHNTYCKNIFINGKRVVNPHYGWDTADHWIAAVKNRVGWVD
jgi:hypothetical protein